MSTLNQVFCATLALGGVSALVGFVGMLVAMAFDSMSAWFTKPLLLGCAAVIVGLIGVLITEPPSPLSRGLVSDKRHRSYTVMLMVGKVFVPSHRETWELVSAEGATCSVGSSSYEAYHVGDAVVCAWSK